MLHSSNSNGNLESMSVCWKVLGCFVATVACGGGDGGTAADQHLQRCGLMLTLEPSSTEQRECFDQCVLETSCEELQSGSTRLSLCFAGCGTEVRCDDGDTIISVDWLCDDEVDCLDGSDERGCH